MLFKLIPKKELLKQLILQTEHIIGDQKDKILDQLDNYSDKKISHLISILESALDLEKRIKSGNSEEVYREIQTKEAHENQKKRQDNLKTIEILELSETKRDERELNNLLKTLNDKINL